MPPLPRLLRARFRLTYRLQLSCLTFAYLGMNLQLFPRNVLHEDGFGCWAAAS